MGDVTDPSARVEPNHRGCQVAGPTMQLKLQPDFLPYAAKNNVGLGNLWKWCLYATKAQLEVL